MKNKTTLAYCIGALFIGTLLFACAEAPKKEDNSSKNEEMEQEEQMGETTEEEDENSYILPSPIQIAAIFNRAGLEYESGLPNAVENISKYNTKTAKYLNFGVYSADLAYVVLNDQQQLSIDYINNIKKLTDEIGMPSIFGSGRLIESFENNVGNQDTVLRILTIIKRRTDQFLEDNKDNSKEAIFFSGAWLEGMYLGANSASNTGNRVVPRIIEQMTILENIIKAIKVQNDPSLDVQFMIDGLTDLDETFESFESIKKFDREDLDFDEIELSEEELSILKEKISALRTKVIEG